MRRNQYDDEYEDMYGKVGPSGPAVAPSVIDDAKDVTPKPAAWSESTDEEMTFVIPDSLLIHLETWISSAGGREVSGVATMVANPEKKTFTMNKCWLMAAGSIAYTEIPAERMANLIKEGVRPDQIKVWWHRHPVGNGIPGGHNWSGRDNQTIRDEPFGIEPEMVGWLLSIVRTPRGWVARYDNHLRKETTHMPVTTRISSEQHAAAAKLIGRHVEAEAKVTQSTAINGKRVHPIHQPRPGFKYPLPNKTNEADKRNRELAKQEKLKQLDLDGGFGTEGLRDTGAPLAERLHEVNWDRDTFIEIQKAMRWDLAEFVAYEHAVTIKEMFIVGLLSRDEVEDCALRVQQGVDANQKEYLRLVANWDLVDF